MSDASPLVEIRGVEVAFSAGRRGWLGGKRELLRAVRGVDLTLQRGECHGLVGESGCGKSTLGRAVLRLVDLADGTVRFDGVDLAGLRASELRRLRQRMQPIFQDPLGALDPRFTIGRAVAEPLVIHRLGTDRAGRERRVAELLDTVGLDQGMAARYPHELSGGQRQRAVIARALATDPDLIVADEPVSALDVSVQAQIINLLADLRESRNLTFLFISHDLRVVQHLCDSVSVMYLGRIVEQAPTAQLFARPRHPYTQALLAAIPDLDPDAPPRTPLAGEVPSPLSPPAGCAFHTRCPRADRPDACFQDVPELLPAVPSHPVACHLERADDGKP